MEEMLKDLNGPWSNAACMGYCLIAMRRAGLRPTAQRRVLLVLEDVFDDVSIKDAEKAGYDNKEA
nr:MAG TPA: FORMALDEHYDE FERREDOXIN OXIDOREDUCTASE + TUNGSTOPTERIN, TUNGSTOENZYME, TUNGSTEN CONTAINING PROTEIN [Caudoviricetes sp.]